MDEHDQPRHANLKPKQTGEGATKHQNNHFAPTTQSRELTPSVQIPSSTSFTTVWYLEY